MWLEILSVSTRSDSQGTGKLDAKAHWPMLGSTSPKSPSIIASLKRVSELQHLRWAMWQGWPWTDSLKSIAFPLCVATEEPLRGVSGFFGIKCDCPGFIYSYHVTDDANRMSKCKKHHKGTKAIVRNLGSSSAAISSTNSSLNPSLPSLTWS